MKGAAEIKDQAARKTCCGVVIKDQAATNTSAAIKDQATRRSMAIKDQATGDRRCQCWNHLRKIDRERMQKKGIITYSNIAF